MVIFPLVPMNGTEGNTMQFKQHPDIEFPQALIDLGFEDYSYRNDSGARAEKAMGHHSIVVWCFGDKAHRENPEWAQFTVELRYMDIHGLDHANHYWTQDMESIDDMLDRVDEVQSHVTRINAGRTF
jgi:uncharacterized protein YecE (DUF72 family)